MNEAHACVLCRKPANWNPDDPWAPNWAVPGHFSCHRCEEWLMGLLGDIADRYAILQEADELIPHSVPGERGAPGFGPRSPAVDALLVHADKRTRWTSEHGLGALATVADWARSVREDTSLDLPPDRVRATVPAGRLTMSRELATIRFHFDWLLRQDWLGDFAESMRAVLRSLTYAGRLNERLIQVGPCPAIVGWTDDDTAIPCGKTLRMKADAEQIHCRNCDTVWPRSRWHELGDRWADYATLSDDYNAPVGTLKRWASEDKWRKDRRGGRLLLHRDDAEASWQRHRNGKVA